MKVKFIYTLALALSIIGYCSAQQEIPVNMYTGTPGIFVNLYTLTDHDLSESIALSYNPGDLALDAPHTYGIGWNLTSGTQQVSRQVRGLPDDFMGVGALVRRGWLYANNFSSILNFPNSSDLSAGTCPDEQADQGFINNLDYENDTEPDWFSFSVGGYSGHFMFGNDGAIHLIPYQDIRIVPHYADAPTSMAITGWTITTSNGVVYTLNEQNTISRSLTKSSSDEKGIDETMLSVMEREYQHYRKTVNYTSNWMLSAAASPSGALMTYTYTSKEDTQISNRSAMLFDGTWQSGNTTVTLPAFTLMKENTTVNRSTISTITTSSGMWASFSPTDGIKISDPLRTPAVFKQFQLAYSGDFLTSVTESDATGCNKMPPYQFYYRSQAQYPLSTSMSTESQDFWGYYNGSENFYGNAPCMIPTIYVYPNESGADRYRLYPLPSYSGPSYVLNGCANRRAEPNAILTGTLTRLAYPSGGEAHFAFEANQFYDAKANIDQYGGGIRINTITYYDGVNTAPNIVKYFNYTDASGHSSGRLITRPAYALPLWQQIVPTLGTYVGYTKTLSQLATPEAQWRAMTLLTSFDVSDQDYTQGSAVGYSRVAVTRPGSGKAVYEYAVPATYGSNATGNSVTDWSGTITKFARPSDCPSMGLISGGEVLGYPSFPNNYYDYDRGLQLSKTEYNNSGTAVRYTQNTYQYLFKSGSQPSLVSGLSYDMLGNSNGIYLYGRYTQLADVTKVPLNETVTTYDENNTSRAATEVTQYNYQSSYHRMVSSIKRTTTDGTILTSYLKYAQDFPATTATPADTALWMIQRFMASGQNTVVIETQNTMQPSGSSEKTTGATLLKFSPFGFDKPLLRTTMVFRPANAASDFIPASVNQDVLVYDNRYKTVSTVNEYSSFNVPLSATGENRATQASLWGYDNRLPVASIKKARTISVGFSDFETTNSASFSVSSAYTGAGRTGANGIHPYATLTRTIAKPASAEAYVLAFWLKNTANTSVTLQVTTKNIGGAVLSSNNYSYTLKGNAYEYFVQPIDVSGLPDHFMIEIKGQSLSQPSGSSPSLLPMMDDIGFYPDYASLSSVTYDLPFGASSATDETGQTAYTIYDALGRARWMLDQDNNIRKRFTYQLTGQTTPSLTAVISGHTGNYVSYPITFTAQDNSCLTGEFYEWNFGGGFTALSQSNTAQYTYQATGAYTVTLRVSHPSYAHPVTTTTNITLGYAPLEQESCAIGVKTITNGGVVTESYTGCGTNVGYAANYITGKVLFVTNTYGQAVTYTWQKRNAGTTSWVWTGTSSSATYGPVKVDVNSTSGFDLKCVITSSDGRSVDSDIFTVTVVVPPTN